MRWLLIATLSLLALAAGAGCHSSETPQTVSGASDIYKEPPSHLPKLAAAAMTKARRWHPDAILVNLEVMGGPGQFQIQLEFFSPSDLTGFIVSEGMGPESDQVVASASWGTVPIPADFIDLPDAIAVMRARGMKGLVAGATLSAVKLCGTVPVMKWEITPANADQQIQGGPEFYAYAPPESARPMDWRKAGELADRALKGDASALATLRQAAQSGDPNAENSLGYALGTGGQGVEKDLPQAASWFCAAAYEGNPAAQFNLGLAFEHQWGVEQDWGSSELYIVAANQGMADAQVNLGVRCYHSRRCDTTSGDSGTLANRAAYWFQKAAAQGNGAAAKNLSIIGAHTDQSPMEMVQLAEQTAFAPSHDWNPSPKGIIAVSPFAFPIRTNDGWSIVDTGMQ